METTILLYVIFFVSLSAPIFLSFYLINRRKKYRRTPITRNCLRGPGESLRNELEIISEKLDDFFWYILMLSLFTPCLLVIVVNFGNGKLNLLQLCLLVVCYLLIIMWTSQRLYNLLRCRQDLCLGLDAEQFVGHELNALMLDGYRVFHDFPAENFNIDHVVVGPAGVFAVETKGRPKPDKQRENDAKVSCDGELLRFPDWVEKEPLEQARRQANWLNKWLSSAIGQTVSVRPVLALPGWFIQRTKRSDVPVYNGVNPQFLLQLKMGEGLSDILIQRIAHQLEQRCRDVEPTAYRKEKKQRSR